MGPARTAWLLVALLGAYGCGSREGLAVESPREGDAGAPDSPANAPDAAPDSGGTGTDDGAADAGCPSPRATTAVTVVGSVSADSTPPSSPWSLKSLSTTSNFPIAVDVYDSLGRPHTTTIFLIDTAAGAWAYHVVANGAEIAGGQPGSLIEFASGTLAFGWDGALTSAASQGGAITFQGAEPSALDYRLELTQLGGDSFVLAQSQDGLPACDANAGDAGPIACGAAQPTTSIGVAGNLAPNDTPPSAPWDAQQASSTSNFGTGFVVYDPLGGVHEIAAFFIDQGSSGWAYRLVANGNEVAGKSSADPVEFAAGTFAFRTDGSFASAATTGGEITFRGASAQRIALDPSGLTHLPESSRVVASGQDGRAACAAAGDTPRYVCATTTSTSQLSLALNFDPSAAPPQAPWDVQQADASSNFATATDVVDSSGTWHPASIYFVAEASGQWGYHVLVNAGETAANPPGPKVEVLSGELSFTTDGALQSNDPSTQGAVQFRDAQGQTLSVDFGVPVDQGGSGFDQTTELQGGTEVFAQSQDGRVDCSP